MRYGSGAATVQALDDVSLSFARGDFICIVGPSGCGKTTLLQTLAGFLPPSTGRVVVDQLYAQFQHEDLALHHPRGGQARYLAAPLYENATAYMDHLALTVLEDGGKDAMREITEDLCDQVFDAAPLLFGNLKRSGHPTVEDGGVVIYDREPDAHRLSEEEISALMMTDFNGWVEYKGRPIFLGSRKA